MFYYWGCNLQWCWNGVGYITGCFSDGHSITDTFQCNALQYNTTTKNLLKELPFFIQTCFVAFFSFFIVTVHSIILYYTNIQYNTGQLKHLTDTASLFDDYNLSTFFHCVIQPVVITINQVQECSAHFNAPCSTDFSITFIISSLIQSLHVHQ